MRVRIFNVGIWWQFSQNDVARHFVIAAIKAEGDKVLFARWRLSLV